MKCGETYTFGRNNHGNALEIHHKTVSKTVGAFCVGGWTADDIVRSLPLYPSPTRPVLMMLVMCFVE